MGCEAGDELFLIFKFYTMNEVLRQGNEGTLQMSNELLKALIDKSVENGKAVQENAARLQEIAGMIGRLPDRGLEMAKVLEQLDIVQFKQSQQFKEIGEVETHVKEIAGRDALTKADLEGLHGHLSRHAALFEKPLAKSVRYTHVLDQSFWALLVMAIVIITITVLWIHTGEKADRYKEGDIKWRHVKLDTNPLVRRAFAQAEYEYKTDADGFRRQVEAEEENRHHLFDQ
jgi:hypothetical protein